MGIIDYNDRYELCQWLEISKEYGYGWKPIAEYSNYKEAEAERNKKRNKYDYMVRKKRIIIDNNKSAYFRFSETDIHKGLSASQRRELWNSDNPKDFKKIL